MAANNNTTSLSTGPNPSYGTVGTRNFKDFTAREISSAISRNEYRKAVVSDDRMAEFRNAVYKLVSTWSLEDKVNIITEYGDAGILIKYKNPSEEIINRVCTESIIIHLEPDELKQLYNDVSVQTKGLKQEIKQQEQKRKTAKQRAKTFLNTNTFEEAYGKIKGAQNPSEYKKMRKAYEESYKVPKAITRQYRTLRNELMDVLRTCFNKVEISGLAHKMRIEFEPGIKEKDLFNLIVNKVCLFVDLVVGKSKQNYGNAIVDTEPYFTLLKYTSYSYITGEAGLNPEAWAELKKQARRAKVAIDERAKMQRQKKMKTSGNEISQLTGGVTGSGKKQFARNLKNNDSGVLADASYEDLVVLAGRYGVDPTSKANRNIGMLKARIYNGMRLEARRVSQLEKQKGKLEKKGKTTRGVDDLLSIHKRETLSIGSSSDRIPIVKLSTTGKLIDKSVMSAVPVYIVGQSPGGLTAAGKTQLNVNKINNAISSVGGSSSSKGGQASKAPTTKSDLAQKDIDLLNYFLNLKWMLPDPTSTGNIRTLRDVYDYCTTKQGVQGSVFDLAISEVFYGMSPPNNTGWNAGTLSMIGIDTRPDGAPYLEALAYRFLYIYASVMGYPNLAKYLKDSKGIQYKITRTRSFKGNMKAIGSALLKIPGIKQVAGAIKFFTNIKDAAQRVKFPRNVSELPESSKENYNKINSPSMSLPDLARIVQSLGADSGAVTKLMNAESSVISDDAKKALFRAAWAFYKKDVSLERLFLFQADVGIITFSGSKGKLNKNGIYKEYYAAITKSGRGISGAFKTLGKILGLAASGDKGRLVGAGPESSGDGTNLENAQTMPIPKIAFNGGNIDPSSILEVVPVYIVNSGTSTEASTESAVTAASTPTEYGDISGTKDVMKKIIALKMMKMAKRKRKSRTQALLDSPEETVTGGSSSGYDARHAMGSGGANAVRRGTRNRDSVFTEFAEKYGVTVAANGAVSGASPELLEKMKKANQKAGRVRKDADTSVSKETALNIMEGDDLTPLAGLKGKIIPSVSSILGTRAVSKLKIDSVLSIPAIPTYVVNPYANENNLLKKFNSLASTIDSNFSELMLAASTWVSAAPMGVGTITSPTMLAYGLAGTVTSTIKDTLSSTVDTIGDTLGLATGGTVTRMATGGNILRDTRHRFKGITKAASGAVITGDAPGENIFAGGARPELVSSSGDLTVTPLQSESSASTTKVSRMTAYERSQALATSIASHVIRFNRSFGSGEEEVSNIGEAIKVYHVNNVFEDQITVNDETTTMANLIGAMYSHLAAISSFEEVNSSTLASIASGISTLLSSSSSSSSSSSNPYYGSFTSSLDTILSGD